MNREEFMKQLESLLQDITPTEREEALQYYNDYFDDAGSENEQDVIEALGTPDKVAENIKRDISGNAVVEISEEKAVSEGREVAEYQGTEEKSSEPAKTSSGSGMPAWAIVLIVIACIVGSPALFGLAGGVLGGLLGFLAVWFALIFAFGVVALVLLLLLITLVGAGIVSLFTAPLAGLWLIAAGLICGGLGLLFLMLTVSMVCIATPAIFKGIANLCKKIFGKKEVAA